jgi:hypothetical protein
MSLPPPPTPPATVAHALVAILDPRTGLIHGKWGGVPYQMRQKPDHSYTLTLLGGSGVSQDLSRTPLEEFRDVMPLLMQQYTHHGYSGHAPPAGPLSESSRNLLAARVQRSMDLGVSPDDWR